MPISIDELESIVEKLLEEGVTPNQLSRALNLELESVQNAQAHLRVRKYGTDDLEEYTEQMRWDVVHHARQIMKTGSEVERTRFVSAMLGKHLAVSGRRTPESVKKAQDSLMEMMEGMRSGDPTEPIEESRFVARLANRGDDE